MFEVEFLYYPSLMKSYRTSSSTKMFRRRMKKICFYMGYWLNFETKPRVVKGLELKPKKITEKELNYFHRYPNSEHHKSISVLAATLGYIFYNFYENRYNVYTEASKANDPLEIPLKSDLPKYSFEEVAKHTNKEERIWVTFQHGVYDVTDFVQEHPGGDQIMLAAGNAVDPFWNLYSIHLNPHVLEILEKYRIGNLDLKESDNSVTNMSDPYANEPKRHNMLKPASQKPFNAEAPEFLLVENGITPNELFYVRNHLPVPDIDPESYVLEIEIEGKTESVCFSLDDLKKLPRHTVTATVMCAGNRRSEMTKIKPVKGLSWGGAAVGNATWAGASLRDVLRQAGLTDEDIEQNNHVQFEAHDKDAKGVSYGASIPIWKAVDERGDVILAYEMNGETLPRDHGFPVRAIVPGVVGARNVKWLERIIISQEESQSHWQQNDYKGFSPSTDWDTVDFSKSPSIQELPVTSVICQPIPNTTVKVKDGFIEVKGYAWSGGGQDIVRVDVTCDGGNTWHVASFDYHENQKPPRHWSWTLWSCEIPVPDTDEKVEIMAKAVDSSYNTQPESFKNIWNLRGVLANAYHKINVILEK